MMSSNETALEVNDYLDLYLLAKSTGDQAWQDEIISKLKNVTHQPVNHTQMIHNLWTQFKNINEEILALYHELRTGTSTSYLEEKIMNLKYKRIEITRKLRMETEANPSIKNI
jgi:hypothetical protein